MTARGRWGQHAGSVGAFIVVMAEPLAGAGGESKASRAELRNGGGLQHDWEESCLGPWHELERRRRRARAAAIEA